MSKKYRDYTKPETIPVEETAVESAPPVLTEDEPTVEEEVKAPVIGVVSDCVKLNVRAMPSKDAPVICVIPLGTEVQVMPDESTEDFYKVVTELGIEGYCVNDYVNVNI